MIQSWRCLGRLLGLLLKTRLPLMKNVIKLLAKSLLISLGLTAAASGSDAGIHKKTLDSVKTMLIISIDEMEDIMKIVKFLEYFGFLLKGVNETIQNEAKEQNGILLSTLDSSLLGNTLSGRGMNGAEEWFIRSGYRSTRSSIKDF